MTRTRNAARVLVVDDKREMAEMLAEGLRDHGYDAQSVDGGARALAALDAGGVDALVTDLRMPEVDGLQLLAAARRRTPAPPVLVMTAFGAIDTAIESIRLGAYHYLTKPFKLDELLVHLGRALSEGGAEAFPAPARASTNLVAESPAMRTVLAAARRVAMTDAPVLLTGETGTGKSALARFLHDHSPRSSRPFVALNCAALTESLLESELFGHVRGSFTGATSDRAGLFAEADGGTLFLDEIGDLPAGLQAKLLRVLETGLVRPVGSSRERSVDFRLVAATHRDLHQRAREGSFRADLLYRLEVVPLHVPPLRDRPEDLPILIGEVLANARRRYPHSPVERLSPATLETMLAAEWRGNVRELVHLVERLVILGTGAEASLSDLPGAPSRLDTRAAPVFASGEVLPIREVQRRYAAWALEQCGGQRGRAAERLGVDGKTLARWLSPDPESP